MPDLDGNALSKVYNSGDVVLAGGTLPTAPTVPPTIGTGFGYGGFGADDWNYQVMWRVLTTDDMKARDGNDPKRAFRRWRRAIGQVLDNRRMKARDFWHLISAQHCPSSKDSPSQVVPVNKEAGDGVVTVTVDGFSAAQPLGGIQPGWTWVCPDGSAYEVKAVRKGYDPDSFRPGDGLIYGLLYEFDLDASAVGDVPLGSALVYRPDVLRRLAAHMGVAVAAGLRDELRRGLVQRGHSTFALKGTLAGYIEHGRQSGFQSTVTPLSSVDADAKAQHNPADLLVGAVPWEGFVPFLGDGAANVIDSQADQSTMAVADEFGPVWGLARKIGASIPGAVEAGSLSILYSIRISSTVTKTFRAVDDGAGKIVASSTAWTAALGVTNIGVIDYATGHLALLGANQDDFLEVKAYPFVKDVRIEADFRQERDYSTLRPAIARMDQVIADAQQLDVYKWEDPTEYEHPVTIEAIAADEAGTPYTPASEHRVTITWTTTPRPMALDASKVPRGFWRLEDNGVSWWIERVEVEAGKDVLVVAGTDFPNPSGTAKVVYDPPVVPSDGFAPCARVKVALSALTPSWYAEPVGNEDDRYLARLSEVVPAHVIVVKTE